MSGKPGKGLKGNFLVIKALGMGSDFIIEFFSQPVTPPLVVTDGEQALNYKVLDYLGPRVILSFLNPS